jgi:hypothetical protein
MLVAVSAIREWQNWRPLHFSTFRGNRRPTGSRSGLASGRPHLNHPYLSLADHCVTFGEQSDGFGELREAAAK